ncbi:MAG TPA: aspartate:alanine exchanger family transporter [Candidatus Hydrogenedentes bacterium]|nr:aspartate:alanine exchanger family transporter [Candidatus Hydrogenedentota bacterium]HRZ81541.1 aspartate:alanine exchanger family transporter [Candidatus Hydrogenedentota bacterium]
MKHPGVKCILLLVLAALAAFSASPALADAAAAPAQKSAADELLGNPMIALFAVIGAGMLFGRIQVFGVSFGSSGVIFSALLLGGVGYGIPAGIGNLGLVLFVYCVGLTAGPTFFRVFKQEGANLAKLGAVIILAGAATTVVCAWLFKVPVDLAAGVLAGSMTSTPALASALDALNHNPNVSVGYGIAYVYGVVGVVLFVQLVPRMLGYNLEEEVRRAGKGGGGRRIERVVIEVLNPGLFGKLISENSFTATQRCQISRVGRGDRFVPVTPDTRFEEGQVLMAVGEDDRLPALVEFIGRQSDKKLFLDIETERLRVVATSPQVLDKTLRELNLLNAFGVTITRVERNTVAIVPQADTVLQYGDVLTAIGEPKGLQGFAAFAGHRTRALDETDIISLAVGISLGLLIGMIPLGLPGGRSFSLGAAGGPLMVALVLAHFGSIGGIRGHVPRAARMLMTEMGLVFFLAGAGVQAGGQFMEVLRQQGPSLLVMGFFVTTVPMLVGYIAAKRFLRMGILETLGAICGGMTCTPGLGALSSKIDSDIPAISYAAVYPVALILVTLAAQIVVQVLPGL